MNIEFDYMPISIPLKLRYISHILNHFRVEAPISIDKPGVFISIWSVGIYIHLSWEVIYFIHLLKILI